MIINIKHEMLVFWAAFFAGQVICFIFDFFRSLRKFSKPGRISVAIQDMIFCTLGFKIFFDVLYLTDNGAVRWYSLAAACLGAVLYFCTQSRFIMKMHLFFLSLAAKILSPFLKLFRYFKKHTLRLSNAVWMQISSIFLSIRQFHTKKNSKPHENTDAI